MTFAAISIALGAPQTVDSQQQGNRFAMTLTTQEREALESIGVDGVRAKLAACPGLGRGAEVRGFVCGSIDQGKCEDWLGEKYHEQAANDAAQRALQAKDHWWNRVNVWVAIGGVLVGSLVTWFLAK
jgi:hypothetical protein